MSIEIKCDECRYEIRKHDKYHIWCDGCVEEYFKTIRNDYELQIEELQTEIEELKERKK
jgi:hypothetical protein